MNDAPDDRPSPKPTVVITTGADQSQLSIYRWTRCVYGKYVDSEMDAHPGVHLRVTTRTPSIRTVLCRTTEEQAMTIAD
jgi:hypothetical protein